MKSTRLKSETFSTRQFFGTSEREKSCFEFPIISNTMRSQNQDPVLTLARKNGQQNNSAIEILPASQVSPISNLSFLRSNVIVPTMQQQSSKVSTYLACVRSTRNQQSTPWPTVKVFNTNRALLSCAPSFALPFSSELKHPCGAENQPTSTSTRFRINGTNLNFYKMAISLATCFTVLHQ